MLSVQNKKCKKTGKRASCIYMFKRGATHWERFGYFCCSSPLSCVCVDDSVANAHTLRPAAAVAVSWTRTRRDVHVCRVPSVGGRLPWRIVSFSSSSSFLFHRLPVPPVVASVCVVLCHRQPFPSSVRLNLMKWKECPSGGGGGQTKKPTNRSLVLLQFERLLLLPPFNSYCVCVCVCVCVSFFSALLQSAILKLHSHQSHLVVVGSCRSRISRYGLCTAAYLFRLNCRQSVGVDTIYGHCWLFSPSERDRDRWSARRKGNKKILFEKERKKLPRHGRLNKRFLSITRGSKSEGC